MPVPVGEWYRTASDDPQSSGRAIDRDQDVALPASSRARPRPARGLCAEATPWKIGWCVRLRPEQLRATTNVATGMRPKPNAFASRQITMRSISSSVTVSASSPERRRQTRRRRTALDHRQHPSVVDTHQGVDRPGRDRKNRGRAER